MKYYSLSTLKKINSNNAVDQNQGEAEWKYSCEEYDKAYSKIKHLFSLKLQNRLSEDFFHDANIERIELIEKGALTATVFFDRIFISGEHIYKEKLVHYNVKSILFNIDDDDGKTIGEYLVGEIFVENGLVFHNFITTEGAEVNIVCKKVELFEWK